MVSRQELFDAVWPDTLEASGYFIGGTGKLWGPGNWEVSGWSHNPAGPSWSRLELEPPAEHIRSTDYAANFEAFLKEHLQPALAPYRERLGAEVDGDAGDRSEERAGRERV